MYARYPAHSHSIWGAPRSMTARPAKMATAVMTTLDRYAAWNANFVPVVPDPHSGPRRAKRAKKTLATSRGLRWAGVPNARLWRVGVEDIKGGARGWLQVVTSRPGHQA